MASSDSGGRWTPAAFGLAALVAVAGAATMVIELGAVRLLAPWFGTSSSVWTNVIGVVLAALALGYTLGARLASGASPLRTLGLVLLLGAGFAAWLPLAASSIAGYFMPAGVALHDAADLLVWGSLGAAAALFLPAATTLGCAGPLAVEALQRMRGGAAGRAGGHVLAASTLGSLAGTFGTTHLLIPGFGVTKTFLIAASALAVSGATLLWVTRARGVAAPAVLLALFGGGLAMSLGGASDRSAGDGETLLSASDSALQSLRVIETGEGDQRMRFLRVNESLDSFQSIWKPNTGLLGSGFYYDHFALPYAWTARAAGTPPPTWDVFIIGLGAGTAVRVLEGCVAPETTLRTVGIEIDADVVELGERYFGLENNGDSRVAIGGMDGRAALRYAGRTFDQLIVDAYANNMEIPPHLASVEAFAEMGELLNPGGWVTINVGGFGFDDPVVRAVAAAASEGLDAEVSFGRVPFSRNISLHVRPGAKVPSPGTIAFGSRGTPLIGGAGQLVAPLSAPDAWKAVASAEFKGRAFHDDNSGMEALQLESIRRAADRLAALDDPERDGRDSEKAPSPATDEDHELAQSAKALYLRERDTTVALQAAAEIASPAVRAEVESYLLWSAGDLFGALEAATQGLERSPRDVALLQRAVDLGLIVGADKVSALRLARLKEALASDPPRAEAMAAAVTALEGYQADATAKGEAKSRALTLAKRTAGLLMLAAIGLILVLSWPRRHTPAAAAG